MKEIVIFVEAKDGSIEKPTLELMHLARALSAELDARTGAIVLGDDVDSLAEVSSSYGIDKIYKIQDSALKNFMPDIWLCALEKALKKLDPKVILMTHSPIGSEIAPRLAFRLNTAVTTDCTNVIVDKDDQRIIKTKPIYGGNAIAILKSSKEPEVITLRKNSFPVAEPISGRSEIQELNIHINRDKIKVEVIETKEREMVELDKAEVVISGGRGIASLDDFKMLEDLAKVLQKSGINAMVGCSRPIVDKGWFSSDRQIGLTGTMVGSNLYIAIGISGAIQHLVGMVRSKKIISINTDQGCNMFKVSDYGIMEDYKDVLPHLIKRMEG